MASGQGAELPWRGSLALCDAAGKPLPIGEWTLEAQLRGANEVVRAAATFEICSCTYY
jgi:hypothetical protein